MVLNSIEEDDPAHRLDIECIKGARGNFSDGDDALRRLGLGGGSELLFRDLRYFDV